MSLVELAQQIHCDPSYLGRIERAERPIPTRIAESADHALGAHGTLIRLHTLAQSHRELTDTTPPDEDNRTADVANQPGSLADRTTVAAVLDTSEEVIVPARTAAGRVISVSVPRRLFLQGLGSAAVSAATLPDLHFCRLRW